MLALPAVLTHAQAGACLEQLCAGAATSGPLVVLDAQALQEFDSSALAVLLALRRTCLRLGKPLRIEGAPARFMHLAALYGVRALLENEQPHSALHPQSVPA